jgi:predicted O-methyltransferase YrrM
MPDEQERPGDPRPESRFFEPTDRCPHPVRWTSTDGDSTELEVTELVAALVRAVQPDFVIETGAAFGQTTEAITRALWRNGHGRLFSFETDKERNEATADRLLAVERELGHDEAADDEDYYERLSAPLRCTILRRDPQTWFVAASYPPIDLLFLDTTRDARVDEFLHFHPHMRAGTVAVFHDSAWDMGPLRGWIENALVTPGLVRAIDLPTPRGVTICEVLK